MESIKVCSIYENEEEHYLCCVNEVGDMIKRIVRNFQLFERDQIKSLGFTSSQCYCLIELLEHDEMTMQDLSNSMRLNTSTMTRIVDKLVRDQYLQRNRSKEDRRIVVVRLTEKGLESATLAKKTILAYYSNVTSNLPKDEIDEMLKYTAQLMDAFEKANPECC